ncbi:MAG: Oxidoreductase FAD/NAD(P)-binding domain protein [Microgenomates group bacterium GW2011_GWA1_48_10]|nr:MAG: Oxidoreductase FAD/NAD(P)-binding domain protein [Microgenomates group bacterium GW2011_GWA1_48_10]
MTISLPSSFLIDDFLNRITMYRLVLYVLIFYVVVALVFSFFGLLPFSPERLLISSGFIVGVSYGVNVFFSRIFRVATNGESVYITGLILALIISPPANISGLAFLFWAAVVAMAAKFILTVRRKHLFNPAALAVLVTAVFLGRAASWWVGTEVMLPFVAVGGFLVVRKLRRFDLVLSFLLTAMVTTVVLGVLGGAPLLTVISRTILNSAIVFFATVMLTEPMTTPPASGSRALYGLVVGFLAAPQVNLGGIYSSPELALVVGNVFSFIVSPKGRFFLKLREKNQMAADQWDFVFTPDQKVRYLPGQYMEWTLGHQGVDGRGNRRYFTLASSPSEEEIRLGVKFVPEGSSFKRALRQLPVGESLVAAQLAGEFTLSSDPQRKYVFLAGGIGITPFRSMIKFLLDSGQRRDIILFYLVRSEDEVVYREIFDRAKAEIGIKVEYVLSEKLGHLKAVIIAKEVADYQERYFYISGSHSAVVALEREVRSLGVPGRRIKKDFFPGYV